MKLQVTMKLLGRTIDLVECQKLMKQLYFVQNSISIDQAIHHLLPEKQHQQLPWPCQSEHMPVKIREGPEQRWSKQKWRITHTRRTRKKGTWSAYLSSFSGICKFWDIFQSFTFLSRINACLHKWPETYQMHPPTKIKNAKYHDCHITRHKMSDCNDLPIKNSSQ